MQIDNFTDDELQTLLDNLPNHFYAVNTANWTIERIERDEMGWDMGEKQEMRISGTSVDGGKRTCLLAINDDMSVDIKFSEWVPNFKTYNLASFYTFKEWYKQLTPAHGKVDLESLDQYSIDFLKLKKDHPHLFV